jgi:hypothetical protein
MVRYAAPSDRLPTRSRLENSSAPITIAQIATQSRHLRREELLEVFQTTRARKGAPRAGTLQSAPTQSRWGTLDPPSAAEVRRLQEDDPSRTRAVRSAGSPRRRCDDRPDSQRASRVSRTAKPWPTRGRTAPSTSSSSCYSSCSRTAVSQSALGDSATATPHSSRSTAATAPSTGPPPMTATQPPDKLQHKRRERSDR